MRYSTKEKYKKIYELRYIKGLSDKDICSHVPQTTVRTIQKAVKYIQEKPTTLENTAPLLSSMIELEQKLTELCEKENQLNKDIDWLFMEQRKHQREYDSNLKTKKMSIFQYPGNPYSKHLNAKLKLYCKLLHAQMHLWEIRQNIEGTFKQSTSPSSISIIHTYNKPDSIA